MTMPNVIPQANSGWWAMMFGIFFLAFVLYVASNGNLAKYKAWIF